MLRNLIRGGGAVAETRAMQVFPWGPWNGSGGATAAGVPVTQDNAMQLLVVHGAISLISDTIATLPRGLFRDQGDGTSTEVLVKPRWLEQPNPATDIIEFITQTLLSLLLDGNAYWAYGIDGNFLPTEIHVLDPTQVEVKPATGTNTDTANRIEYWVRGERFRGHLLHIKGISRPGHLKGLSPIGNAMQSIGIGLAAQQFAGSFYQNGTILSGVIETPGELTRDQARDLKKNFERDHSGPSKAHGAGVLTNGATWKPLSVTPEQAQFLATREYQAAELCAQLFLLDPSMLGIASAGTRGQNLTYANLEQRGIHLVQFTLMRWIIRIERAFTTLLPKPQYLKLNVDALQRADLKTRYEAHRIALGPNQPFEAVNEVRALEELTPLAGYDEIIEPPVPTVAPAQPQKNAERMPDVNVNMAPPVINLPPPIIHVTSPDVHVDVAAAEAPQITYRAPDVYVETPVINVAAAEAPIVNIAPAEAPIINVAAPEVRVDAPIVHVAAPDVHVDAPIINVAAPEVRVEVEAPTVNVAPPEVRIDSPVVHVAAPDVHVEVAAPNVTMPEIRVDSPVVHVAAPDVHVDVAAPTVNVEPPEVRVDVAAPEVQVHPPAVTIESPIVNFRAPDIQVAAPIVNFPDIHVAAPEVNVAAPEVNVESPIVNVRPPSIRIDAPVINMPAQKKIRRTFEKDDNGVTIAIIEEPIESDVPALPAGESAEQGSTQ